MAFGVDLGGMGSVVFGWGSSLLFWAIVIFVLMIMFVGFLMIMRQFKFRYPCLEVVSLGQGKVSTQMTKAGWFKKRRLFFNLIEVGGEQELICKADNRKIFCVSSTDYHEINGKRGLICKRKDDDPEVLVPIDKVAVDNLQLLMRIAPADYRDAAVDILENKRRETLTWMEKNAPIIFMGGLIILSVIALVIIFNFAKGESAAWREYAMAARGAVTTVSTAAP